MLELSDNVVCSYGTADLDVGLEKMEIISQVGRSLQGADNDCNFSWKEYANVDVMITLTGFHELKKILKSYIFYLSFHHQRHIHRK